MTPRLLGRGTYYGSQLNDDGALVSEPTFREYIGGGVDIVGPSASRIFDASLGPYYKLKHLVEPRIEYVYLGGTQDTSNIPVADEVDVMRLTNRVRLVLNNRLYGRSASSMSARELISFGLSQEYSFDEPLTRGPSLTSPWSALRGNLRLTPTVSTTLDMDADYDTLHDRITRTSLSANQSNPYGSFALSWYQNFSPVDGERGVVPDQHQHPLSQTGIPVQRGGEPSLRHRKKRSTAAAVSGFLRGQLLEHRSGVPRPREPRHTDQRLADHYRPQGCRPPAGDQGEPSVLPARDAESVGLCGGGSGIRTHGGGTPQRFSRPPPSSTRPSLRMGILYSQFQRTYNTASGPERCWSGRSGLPAKQLSGVTWTGGSNPPLSAKLPGRDPAANDPAVFFGGHPCPPR